MKQAHFLSFNKRIFTAILLYCCSMITWAQDVTQEPRVAASELTATASITLPQHDELKHLGVASCAASMCHGSTIPRSGSDILQNEYITWSREDAHAQAYKTLLTAQSQKIADKLGLPNAHEAAVCLDCHTDNVKKSHQGERFQISDGIGCEACHGGAEHYISSHTDSNIPRAENLANGLLAIDRPQVRAQVCLSCHLGNKDKFASHDIMGAGHPRLAFELDTFGILQPLHYVVDRDYKTRKWFGNSYMTWLYGQFTASRETLLLIEDKITSNKALFPEISLFDCHSCHHLMSDLAWTKTKGQGFKPGTVRLNDGNLKMLMAIASITPLKNTLHQHISDVTSALNDKAQLKVSSEQVLNDIQQLQLFFENQVVPAQKKQAKSVLIQVLTMGSQSAFSDYIAAEQTVMAIDLLLVTIEQRALFEDEIKQLFELVNNENAYQAPKFTEKMIEMKGKVNLL